jgi:hypothetical protein
VPRIVPARAPWPAHTPPPAPGGGGPPPAATAGACGCGVFSSRRSILQSELGFVPQFGAMNAVLDLHMPDHFEGMDGGRSSPDPGRPAAFPRPAAYGWERARDFASPKRSDTASPDKCPLMKTGDRWV